MGKETIVLKPNVLDFIHKTSEEIGKFYSLDFAIDVWGKFQDHKITSPIEQLLFCALME